MDLVRFVADYQRDGVVRYRSLLNQDELSEVRRELLRYRSDVMPSLPTADFTLEPDGATVRNFWRMHEHDPFFAAFAVRPRLMDLVGPLVNGQPVLMGVETFNKPAFVGSAVPPHQDNAYFCQNPPEVLTVWIAIDPASEENGAVEYALGSQQELLPHAPSGVKGNSFGLAEPQSIDRFRRMKGVIDSGDALIHHSQTIHWSRPNRSDRSRLSLVLVYRGEHTRTDETLQEQYRSAQRLTPQNA